jgi:hypothetical protein
MIKTILLLLLCATLNYSQPEFDFGGFTLKYGMDQDFLYAQLTSRGYSIDNIQKDSIIVLAVFLDNKLYGTLRFKDKKLERASRQLGSYDNSEISELVYNLFDILIKYEDGINLITAIENKPLGYNEKEIRITLQDGLIVTISIIEKEQELREGNQPLITLSREF